MEGKSSVYWAEYEKPRKRPEAITVEVDGTEGEFRVWSSSSCRSGADVIGMNYTDLAPTSPLILAELAPAITYRAVDPASVDPALAAAAAPKEPAVQPTIEIHLGNAFDAYM